MTKTTSDANATSLQVKAVLAKHGRLSKDVATLSDDASLSEAGMTSHASVNVMLALEAEFGEIPDHLLTRSAFQSIASITRTVMATQAR